VPRIYREEAKSAEDAEKRITAKLTKSTKHPLLARTSAPEHARLARSRAAPDGASARLLRNRTSATGLESAETVSQ
jgi:hypothetical protein